MLFNIRVLLTSRKQSSEELILPNASTFLTCHKKYAAVESQKSTGASRKTHSIIRDSHLETSGALPQDAQVGESLKTGAVGHSSVVKHDVAVSHP